MMFSCRHALLFEFYSLDRRLAILDKRRWHQKYFACNIADLCCFVRTELGQALVTEICVQIFLVLVQCYLNRFRTLKSQFHNSNMVPFQIIG